MFEDLALKPEPELALEQQLQLKDLRIQELEIENDQLRQTVEILERESGLDALTKVNNLRGFARAMEKLVPQLFPKMRVQKKKQRRLERERLCVLYLDIDGFKAINDQYSHSFGNLVLQKAAEYLVTHVRRRETDIVNRIFGDEFVIIYPGWNSAGVMKALRGEDGLVRLGFQAPLQWKNGPDSFLEVSFSGGLTDFDPIVDQSWEYTVYRADQCLRLSKQTGRRHIRKFPAQSMETIFPGVPLPVFESIKDKYSVL